jgi:hypothetical protein
MSKRFGGTKISNKGKIYDIDASLLISQSSLLANMISDLGDNDNDVIPLEVDGPTFDVIESYIKTKKIPQNVDIESLLLVANYLEMTPLKNEIYEGIKDGLYKFTPPLVQHQSNNDPFFKPYEKDDANLVKDGAKLDMIDELLDKYVANTNSYSEILKLARNTGNLYPYIGQKLIQQKTHLPPKIEWSQDKDINYVKLYDRLFPNQIITPLPQRDELVRFHCGPLTKKLSISYDGALVVVNDLVDIHIYVLDGLKNTKIKKMEKETITNVKVDYMTKEIVRIDKNDVSFYDTNIKGVWKTQGVSYEQTDFDGRMKVNNGFAMVQHSIENNASIFWRINGKVYRKIVPTYNIPQTETNNLGKKFLLTTRRLTHHTVWDNYKYTNNNLEIDQSLTLKKSYLNMIGNELLWFDKKDQHMSTKVEIYLGKKILFKYLTLPNYPVNSEISPDQSKILIHNNFNRGFVYNLNNSEVWKIKFEGDTIGKVVVNNYGNVLNKKYLYVPYGDTIDLGQGEWYLSDFYAVKHDVLYNTIVRRRIMDPSITRFNQNS